MDALAQAKSTGINVPIDALTTEFSETVATPNGHLAQKQHSSQQRLKNAGSWAPLDATLVGNPDGSYSPKTAPGGLTLSAGGGSTFATLTDASGAQLSLSSPFPLPAPTVSRDSLLFDVAKDTTLKVTASKYGGVSTVIILKTAAAAANPALKTLHFGTVTKGVTVTADKDNNLTAKSADGVSHWQATAAKMWDSSTGTAATGTAPAVRALARPAAAPAASPAPTGGPAPAVSSDSGPGAGARVATMPVTAGAGGIDLTPDQDILANGTGPWFIDPSWSSTSTTANLSNWVQSAHQSTNNDNHSGTSDSDHPGVGLCGSSYPNGGGCSPTDLERSFYRFNLSGLSNAVVNSATLHLSEYISADWSCTNTYGVDVYRTDYLSEGTNWANQPTWREYQGTDNVGGSGHSSACYGNIPFSYTVTSAVASQAGGSVSFGVKANDENSAYAFKRLTFDPTLDIQYDYVPNTPTNLKTTPSIPRTVIPNAYSSEACADLPLSAYSWLTTTSPALAATVSSPNQAQVRGWFSIWDNATGGNTIASGNTGYVPNGGTAAFQLPVGALQDGHYYGWHAYTDDGLISSSSSPVCHFGVDLSPPSIAPGKQPAGTPLTDAELATQFPPSGNGQTTKLTVGQSGTIPFTAADTAPTTPAGLLSSGVAKVHWSTDPQMVTGVTDVTYNNTPSQVSGQISVTPTHWGTNIVYFQAEDNAGNKSQVTPYSFYVPWTPGPLAYGDVTGDGHPDVLNPDPKGALLDYGQAITFTAPTVVASTGNIPTAPRIAATAAQAPEPGKTWNYYRITHRGTTSPQKNIDDLFAHHDPSSPTAGDGGQYLYYLKNNLQNNGTFDQGTSTSARPNCVSSTSTDCSNYGSPSSWATVSQITPIGSANAALKPNDTTTDATGVLAVQNGNLWYYPPGGSGFNSNNDATFFNTPIQLTNTGIWGNYDLMIPGDALATGHPALWVRARATAGTVNAGDIYQHTLIFDTNTKTITGIAPSPSTPIGTGVTPTLFPTVGAVGDLTGDGIPDLWATTATGRITTWAGQTQDGASSTAVTGFSWRDFQWLLNPSTTTQDASGDTLGNPLTPSGAVTYSTDAPAQRPLLSGSVQFTGSGILNANSNAVDTSRSYSISAWVKLNSTGRDQTFVGQGGNAHQAFYLGYSAGSNSWTFEAPTTDDNNATWASASAGTGSAQPSKWTQLTATYDATSHTMTLYVNGEYAGSATNPTPWYSRGPLTIGAVHTTTSSPYNQVDGAVADVHTYQYALNTTATPPNPATSIPATDQVRTIYRG